VVGLTLLAQPAFAYVPEQTPQRNAEASVSRALALPVVHPSTPGIVVMRGGSILVERNSTTPLIPASLMKLITTTAAMLRLGPRHRFETRVFADRPGSSVGNLYLVGGGDPTLATRDYRNRRFLPRPDDPLPIPVFPSGSPTVEELAGRIARAGIRRIDGDLIADETFFDTSRTQPGWLSRYLRDDPDTGLLSALVVNEGRASLDRQTIASSPPLTAGQALRTALAARGIRVAGVVRLGETPRRAEEVASVSSPPLSEIVGYINRYSINYAAELVLKGLGAAERGEGTTAAGVAVVREVLDELRIPADGLVMHDGSGLSRLDRATPLTIAMVLERIRTGRGVVWRTLRDTIPVAGGPGTLFQRLKGPPTGGNLRGKTGYLRGVRAMAGWVGAADGVPLVYVGIFNDARSAIALTGPLDLLGLFLALYPYA
jgi:D-alanyl-D-alanine carboxypeptidase/D-alanyl-D-alanine-endopeptidase (penicillin-binding protein 4)